MTDLQVVVDGAAARAVAAAVPTLVADGVASGIAAHDATLWGPDAVAESSKRLGWTNAAEISRPLVADIVALRDRFTAAGVDHVVLGGMGGSSLAPEVITQSAGVELTVLDSTEPGQILAAVRDRLERTAVVISSKSGSTLETDSHKRTYERAFREAGIDPTERIVIVTDPGSPLDASAREAGYTVFNADPNVGGRYSALTAFGLVPSGLAGVDIAALLDEADAAAPVVFADTPDNPALVLGAAMASQGAFGILATDSPIVGFGDWAEQLIAESTGKSGTGILPVVLDATAPELDAVPSGLTISVVVADATSASLAGSAAEVAVSGSLGGQFLLWETATAVAGRLVEINPFDQPDVESAKAAARGLLDDRPEPATPAFIEDGVGVTGSADAVGDASTLIEAIDTLLGTVPADGYVSVQAYLDRTSVPGYAALRDILAARTGRPVTFGWGPRFLHSTGQYHKGGTPNGVFLQIVATPAEDFSIPDRPFTFGELIQAQALGDATVLEQHGRPVLRLSLADARAALPIVERAVRG